jgi:hypothetical protein
MSFLYPAFLLGALAVALPIALHLLRRDVAPEVPFSAVRLLRRSPIDRTRRRRLRDILLLMARVAALALLAVAFARPYWTDAAAAPRLRIVAVDRSFSMGAPGRFARAQALAAEAVADAGPGERVAVIAFDDRADVIAPPGSAADARAALSPLTPGFGATRFAALLARAIEVADGQPATLVVVSDLQRNGWEDAQPVVLPATLQVETRDTQVATRNAAVVQVRVDTDRVVATVANSSASQFTGTARITVDGRDAGSAPVSVPANDSVEVAVAYRSPGRGTLAFSIDDAQGFPADNTRYVALEPRSRSRVLVLASAAVPESGVYVSRALEAAEGRTFEARVVSGADMSAMTPEHAARHAAAIVLSTRGLDRRGRETLGGFFRAGGGVFVAAGPDVEPSLLWPALGWPDFGIAEAGQAVALSASDVRHPVFQQFGPFAANLGQVQFQRIWKLRAPGWDVAARFSDGSPALVEYPKGKERSGRALVFASDLDRRWNEFPLHPAFVPFAVEAVRYVAGASDDRREYLVVDAPAGAGPAPGVYRGRDGRAIAINVDPRESAIAPLTSAEFGAMVERPARTETAGSMPAVEAARAQTAERQQNLWQYGLALMLGVLVVESMVGRT